MRLHNQYPFPEFKDHVIKEEFTDTKQILTKMENKCKVCRQVLEMAKLQRATTQLERENPQ